MIRFVMLTISDRITCGEREDASGPLAKNIIEERVSGICVKSVVLPDEQHRIEAALCEFADKEEFDLIVTSGGTGMAPRDVTPEATRAVIDREAPGLAEAMRVKGMEQTPYAMLSRGVCGIRGKTLIVNLSGSPKAVKEQLEVLLPVLPHAIETLRGNIVDCAPPPEGNAGISE